MTIMKRHIAILPYSLLTVLAAMLFSCANTEDLDPFEISTARLVLKTSSVGMEAGANSKTIEIEANCGWTLEGLPDWLSASPAYGDGTTTVTLTAQENSGAERTATISVNGGERHVNFNVAQRASANNVFQLSSNLIEVDDGSSTQTLSLTTNCRWTAAVSYGDGSTGWCRIAPESGEPSSSTQTIKIYIDANPYSYDREADITFTATPLQGGNSLTEALKVKQQKGTASAPVIRSFTVQKIKTTSFEFTIDFESEPACTEYGVLYGEQIEQPTLNDHQYKGSMSNVVEMGGTFTFETTRGVEPGHTYHARGYAVNANGTTYSEIVTFTTPTTDEPDEPEQPEQPTTEGVPGTADNPLPGTPARQQTFILTNSR